MQGRYFRSSWEANIARWLTFLSIRWRYEAHTFEFPGIKRGTRFYTPDFWLPDEDRYIEVKGHMTQKGATAIRRMGKYHPHVDIELIDARRYRVIAKQMSKVVPHWE